MDFHSEESLCFTSMVVKGVLRDSNQKQTHILSVTDPSADSDKKPILFCGDLFNFRLAESINERKDLDISQSN